jgi:hypothetical protein
MTGRRRRNLAQIFTWGIVLLSAIFVTARAASPGGDTDHIHWKPVSEAQVKLGDKTPLAWNVYQPDKKDRKKYSSLILVLLGRRYLVLDVKAKLVYAVVPSDLRAQGTGFESDPLAQPSRLVPSSDWSVRDVGPAELIRLTLGDYGRVLQVSLPHPPDLRPFY